MATLGIVGIGPVEIGIVLLIVLIIFGPKRLPELGKSLGGGMRGFKESVTGKDKDDDESQELKPGTSPTQATAAAPEDHQPVPTRDERPQAAGEPRPTGDATH